MSSYEQSQPAAPPRALANESVADRDYAGQRSQPNAPFGGMSWAISTKELIGLCQRVGQSLHAGVEVRRVWQQEANRGSERHRGHVARVLQQINAGGTVADGMRECGGYFPPLTCQMV